MPGKVKRTPNGKVRTDALEQLEGSFDTQQLLNAVDHLDRLRELVTTPGFRDDLLRLHGMGTHHHQWRRNESSRLWGSHLGTGRVVVYGTRGDCGGPDGNCGSAKSTRRAGARRRRGLDLIAASIACRAELVDPMARSQISRLRTAA